MAQIQLADSFDQLTGVEDEWNDLAAAQPSPFLTLPWLRAWWTAFGQGTLLAVTLCDDLGSLRAGAVLGRTRRGLDALANDHTGDWGVVAVDDVARNELLHALAALPERRVVLRRMRGEDGSAQAAAAVLRAAGYRVAVEQDHVSPYLELPTTADELLSSASHNLRSQVGRRRRGLEREGRVVFRSITGGPTLERELSAFFEVEGSGWKRQAGTAILTEPHAEELYRGFALEAASRGWLRLHLLELDGELVAGDYACVLGRGEFLLKTGFDESKSRLSPGLVLRWEVLRQAVESGLEFYDFLGGPDAYKLRWTNDVRPHFTIHAYRGIGSLPRVTYRRQARPVLKRIRRRVLGLRVPR